jgi:two-component system sensor histidine kinase BaeS
MRQRFMRRMGCVFGILLIAMVIIGLVMADGMMQHRMPLMNMRPFAQNFPFLIRIISWILFTGVILGLVFVGSLFRKAALPIADMLEAAGKIADGDYSARVPENGSDEMSALAKAFNDMATRLQVNEEQRRMLLADISHELRTPLTIIQGNLEGMLDGIYTADPGRLQGLLDETQTLGRIIEDLRTLSVVESGSLKLEFETLNPAEFLEEFIPMYRSLAESHKIKFNTLIPNDLPNIELDPTRIREVLSNLITNALRYSRPGGEINLRVTQVMQPESQLIFTVQDTGAGIPAQDLPHIFERFYKDRDSSGSGLGLPIAKSLVEAHGGKIWAQSQKDQGTTISFSLPIRS